MLTGGKLLMDACMTELMPKGKLDHSELHQSYFLKRLKNDSKTVDQKQDLREARERLRNFESNIEQEMPSLKRLKDFKSIAQEMIEDPKWKTRRH